MQYSNVGTLAIQQAAMFAIAAHGATGQIRKYNGEPYVAHPYRVAKMIMSLRQHTWQMVAAAYLHDVVEDTRHDISGIRVLFTSDVADLVEVLSNVEKSAGSRKVRLELNIERLRGASPEAQTIKCADIYDNLTDLVKLDYNYARFYVPEKKRVLIEALHGCSDPCLWGLTMERVNDLERQIKVIEDGMKEAKLAS